VVAARHRNVTEFRGKIQLLEFPKGNSFDSFETLHGSPLKQNFCILATERLNHLERIYCLPVHVHKYKAETPMNIQSLPPSSCKTIMRTCPKTSAKLIFHGKSQRSSRESG
jgi:hypothetical protein